MVSLIKSKLLVEGDSVAVRDGQADCDRGAHE
jgi:hypothetical protein